jgi:hypothetical protein
VWIFVVAEHFVLGLKFVFGLLVPDTTGEVTLQLKRTEFIKSKLFEKIPDDEDVELVSGEYSGSLREIMKG